MTASDGTGASQGSSAPQDSATSRSASSSAVLQAHLDALATPSYYTSSRASSGPYHQATNGRSHAFGSTPASALMNGIPTRPKSRWDVGNGIGSSSSAQPPPPAGPLSVNSGPIPTGPRSSTVAPPPPGYFQHASIPPRPASLDFVPRANKKARLSFSGGSSSAPPDTNGRHPSLSHSPTLNGSSTPLASTSSSLPPRPPDLQNGSRWSSTSSSISGPSHDSSYNQDFRRPAAGPLKRPSSSSPPRSHPSPSTSTSASASVPLPAADPQPSPMYWKPTGARDFITTYDPTLDASPVKRGKDPIYRFDGEGLSETPTDPRSSTDKKFLERMKKANYKATRQLNTFTYIIHSSFRFAVGQALNGKASSTPPSAILVSGFPPSTTFEELSRHFKGFGRMLDMQNKTDSQTGGSLGICWIAYKDDAVRDLDADKETREKWESGRRAGTAQDGNAVAQEAVAKTNGTRLGPRMVSSRVGIKVVLDGDGKLTKAAVVAEMLRRYPPSKPKPPPPPPPPPPTLVPLPPEPAPKPPPLVPPPHLPARPMVPGQNGFSTPYQSFQQPTPSFTPPNRANSILPSPSPVEVTPPTGPRAMRPVAGREPYQPIVFSGTPTGLAGLPAGPIRISPSGRFRATSNGSGPNPTMAAAVQAAVQEARKLLEVKQKKEAREGEGEFDMELDSDQEAAAKRSSDGEAEEEPVEEKVFYHTTRTSASGRQFLYPGQAPAAAVAWQASPQVLKEKLVANGKAYLTVPRASYIQDRAASSKGIAVKLNGSELEAHFCDFPLERTLADKEGWYITFKTPTGAQEALDKLGGKRFAGAPLLLVLCPPSLAPSAATLSAKVLDGPRASHVNMALQNIISPRVKKTSGWTDAELIDEAADIAVHDLIDAFRSDIKARLLAPKIAQQLTAWEQGGSKSAMVPSPVKSEPGVDSLPAAEPSAMQDLKKLPSFARRKPVEQVRRKSTVPERSRSRLSSEAPSESPDVEARHESPTPRQRPTSTKKAVARLAQESGSDEDTPPIEAKRPDVPKKHKKGKVKPVKVSVHDYTSSEGDDESEADPVSKKAIGDEVHIDNMAEVEKEELPAKKKPIRKKKVKAEIPVVVMPVPLVEEDAIMLDEVAGIPTPAPTDATASTNKPALSFGESDHELEPVKPKPAPRGKKSGKDVSRARDLSPDPFDRGVAADEEDLYFLKLSLQRSRAGIPLHPTPPPSDDESDPPPRHPSGSARTEGFYIVTAAEKLANRPKNVAAKTSPDKSASGVAVSRLARANTRGLVRGMELHKKVTATDTDVLKFNQLRTRKKQLTFKRSGIEGYGLFAKEHIPAGEMVIEYVGELIRQQVADRREKAYERQGIGSSYLFRVDEDLVVDATKKGNLGRLINHCCAPNCTARIITIGGEKKIVIYAKTSIEPGDEVTYDYHFPHEEVKIPCLCGHALCRKYLN